jgi:gluconate 2-dehydrogenase alpha chain
MPNHQPDAIVVGLGAAGGIIAEQLARAGLKVTALDKGPHYPEDYFRFKHDEIRYYTRGSLVPHLSTDPITWRARDGDTATLLPWASGPLGTSEPLHLPPSIGTGGGTLHWGGACWRFRQADFCMRSTILQRFGKDALPTDSTMVDWPVTYQDLEPYYDRVEWELGVSGQAGNIGGERIPGGNPFEEPRNRGYPMPPLHSTAGTGRFVEATERLGYHPFPQAAAIASVDYKALKPCVYCGFCHGYPCHVGAKQSTHVTSIPGALATGNLRILPFSRVYRVNRESPSGHVTGLSYFDAGGHARELTADLVVLACFALENSRLLLLSGIDGNGQVGKHFMTHCFGWFTGVVPEWINPFMGPLVAAHIVDDLTSELIPDNDDGVLWGSPLTSFPGDTQPIEAARNLPPTLPRWGLELKHWLSNNYRRLFSMHTQTPSFPYREGYCDLDTHVKDPYGLPALRITHDWMPHDIKALQFFSRVRRRIADEMGMEEYWEEACPPPYHLSTHEVGTHRMGLDRTASVVDPFGECHHCKGLYVVGGGQFPTLPAYNPTETIQALAFLTADRILGRT